MKGGSGWLAVEVDGWRLVRVTVDRVWSDLW